MRMMFTPSSSTTTASSSGTLPAPSRRSSFSTASSAVPSLPRRFPPRQGQVSETAGDDTVVSTFLDADEAAEDDGAGGDEPTVEEVFRRKWRTGVGTSRSTPRQLRPLRTPLMPCLD